MKRFVIWPVFHSRRNLSCTITMFFSCSTFGANVFLRWSLLKSSRYSFGHLLQKLSITRCQWAQNFSIPTWVEVVCLPLACRNTVNLSLQMRRARVRTAGSGYKSQENVAGKELIPACTAVRMVFSWSESKRHFPRIYRSHSFTDRMHHFLPKTFTPGCSLCNEFPRDFVVCAVFLNIWEVQSIVRAA